MAKRREPQDNLEQTKRISPYQQADDEYNDISRQGDRHAYAGEYDDAGEYEDEYDEQDEGGGGFFSSWMGKLLIAIIVVLLIVLLALVGVRFLRSGTQKKPDTGNTPGVQTQERTPEPTAIVFAPLPGAQETPTPESGAVIFTPDGNVTAPEKTPEITQKPEPTDTPLPIILTNTPTPSPSPTPTAEPTPTLVPTNTPAPSATPAAELAKGKVNRQANLRQTASANGKVKQAVKKGQQVTVHGTVLDKNGKVWYDLTVDDLAVSGWMRDYVVDLETSIPKPTSTPKPSAIPKATKEPGAVETEEPKTEKETGAQDEAVQMTEEAIAQGKTNRDANVRKVMNGKTIATVKKGKSVSIYEALKDKSGNLWYRLSIDETGKTGYMRDYVIDLNDNLKLVPQNDVENSAVGTAKTNRAANVRKTPTSDGKLVRQISEGVKVYILGRYQDAHKQIWYQISTESGNTMGFMRDYVLDNVKLDAGVETLTYTGTQE